MDLLRDLASVSQLDSVTSKHLAPLGNYQSTRLERNSHQPIRFALKLTFDLTDENGYDWRGDDNWQAHTVDN